MGETAEQRQVEPQGEDERQRREERWLLHTCPLLPSSRPLGPSAMQCSPTHGPQSPAQPSAPREWPQGDVGVLPMGVPAEAGLFFLNTVF